MEYKYRKLKSSDLTRITKLIDLCFGLKAKDKKKYVKWKLFQPKNKKIIAYGAFSGKNLVSFYSNKEIAVVKGKNEYKAAVCLDMATHPDHRRKGLISALSKRTYEDINRRVYDFSFGFSNGSGVNVDKYASDYGYKIVGQFHTYRRLVLPTFAKELMGVEKVSKVKVHGKYCGDMYQISPSQDHISWRYLKNAAHSEYEYYKISKNNNLSGYSIVQRDKYKAGILKILCTDPEEVEYTLKSTLHALAMDKARVATITVLPNSFWKQILLKNSFIRAMKKEEYYFTLFPHKPNSAGMLDNEKWLLMGVDLV